MHAPPSLPSARCVPATLARRALRRRRAGIDVQACAVQCRRHAMQRTPLHCSPVRHVFALALAFATMAVALPARGYCRKTTNGPEDPTYDPARTGSCGDGPHALPLHWATRCIEYRVVVDAALVARDLMTIERARAIVRKAIGAWVTAMCGTKDDEWHPAIWLVDVFDARCPGATGRTTNEVQFLASTPIGGDLALTEVTMRRGTGQIDAAVTRVYDVLSSFGSTPAEIDPRAEFVVRHELGHFLGLAHSQDRRAVMFARYENAAVDLGGDDARAICDSYDPAAGAAPDGCRASVAAPRKSNGGGVVLALAVALAVLARRRRAFSPRRVWSRT